MHPSDISMGIPWPNLVLLTHVDSTMTWQLKALLPLILQVSGLYDFSSTHEYKSESDFILIW